jgi:hypothetical protein
VADCGSYDDATSGTGPRGTVPSAVEENTMKSHSFQKLVTASSLVAVAIGLTACAAPRSPADDPRNLPVETASAELRSDRVRNWTVIDDQTMLVEAYDGTKYRAETMGACNGLSFATRLGFSNRGGFKTIDRFSSVLLPDGTKCPLAAFNKVIPPEKSALDSYEKAEKEKDAAAEKDSKDKEQKSDDSAAAKKDVSTAGDAQGSATPR